MTLQKRQFAKEYLVDLNATQAALRAGYSKKTAYSQGQRLLKSVEIQQEIQEAMDARAARTNISADATLREIARLAFSDIRKYVGEGDVLHPISALDDDAASAVSALEVHETWGMTSEGDTRQVTGQVKKLKLWDKTANLALLGRHLKLFIDRVEHGLDESAVSLAERLQRAHQQLEEQRHVRRLTSPE